MFFVFITACSSSESGQGPPNVPLSTGKSRVTTTQESSSQYFQASADEPWSGQPKGRCLDPDPNKIWSNQSEEATEALGDFDGDGTEDEVHVSRNKTGEWEVDIVYENGRAIEADLPSNGGFSHPEALGAIDLDGDGKDEAVLLTDSAANTVGVSFFRVDGCQLTWIRDPLWSERKAPWGHAGESGIRVGGNAITVRGIACVTTPSGATDLVVRDVFQLPSDGAEHTSYLWRISETTLRLQGIEFVEVDSSAKDLSITPGDFDALIGSLYGADCQGVSDALDRL